jgi:hypothetical protein
MSVRVDQLTNQLGLGSGEIVELPCARSLDVSRPLNRILTIYTNARILDLDCPKSTGRFCDAIESENQELEVQIVMKSVGAVGDTISASDAVVV